MEKLKIYAFADEASGKLDGQMEAMKRNGLDGLEIRNTDGVNVSALSREKAKEIARRLRDEGLTVWSVGSPIGKVGIDEDFEAHREVLKHTLEVGNLLGAERIRLFSFFVEEERADNCADTVVDRLGRMAEDCIAAGLMPCHENEKGIYGNTDDRCLNILRQLPTVRGVFDPANFLQCGVETLGAWEKLKPYIDYLHIKDVAADGTVVPAGKGEGHVGQILADYRARGGIAVTLEPHLTVFDGLAALEKDSRSQIAYAYASGDEAFDVACEALRKLI